MLFTGADGTTRVVPGPTSILPKGTVVAGQGGQQSLIRIQPAGTANATVGSPSSIPTQQKVQIVPGPDGKFQVRGLLPGKFKLIYFLTTQVLRQVNFQFSHSNII